MLETAIDVRRIKFQLRDKLKFYSVSEEILQEMKIDQFIHLTFIF